MRNQRLLPSYGIVDVLVDTPIDSIPNAFTNTNKYLVAEKTFLNMRDAAEKHQNIHFIAVLHSEQSHTDEWIKAVGGAGKVGIIVDANRTLYARWGLGVAGWFHLLSWEVFYNVFRLAREEGIKNRPTWSGSRWQTGGVFAVDGKGVVKAGGAALRSDDVSDFKEEVRSVES